MVVLPSLCKLIVSKTFAVCLPLCSVAGLQVGDAWVVLREGTTERSWDHKLKGSQARDLPGCSDPSQHPLFPCSPASHHKLTISPVASSSFSSRGRISLSSQHWEEGERHEMVNKSRTYP